MGISVPWHLPAHPLVAESEPSGRRSLVLLQSDALGFSGLVTIIVRGLRHFPEGTGSEKRRLLPRGHTAVRRESLQGGRVRRPAPKAPLFPKLGKFPGAGLPAVPFSYAVSSGAAAQMAVLSVCSLRINTPLWERTSSPLVKRLSAQQTLGTCRVHVPHVHVFPGDPEGNV